MTADRRLKELFVAAVDVPEAAARQAFVERECGGDAELRQRLEALLRAHDAPADVLQSLAELALTGPFVASAPDDKAKVGALIAGKYKLLQRIGEGGMGSVWMADQTEPVKRRVAVKLIRPERGSSSTILARFEAERQAIAVMDHPNIAKLLDAGTVGQAFSPDSSGSPAGKPDLPGSPFFVMELVKGVPLNQYCDEHKLTVADRLQLFMQICSAVQHAHQKGIIHRDLKPSNVLVESHDGKPVPKVIDFGLAKAMSGQPLTEHTLFTALGAVAGTPLYMSPEQATFNAIDVDTRADIYSLGVLLYELLTGTTPIEREQFKKAAFEEILRAIRESEPPTPSKRLSSTESKPSVAANRQMEPVKLSRFLRGDLDWIVMKALAKERDRRYETANGLARDIERFLTHEPVTAGPPTVRYRLRKFVQRNQGAVVATAIVLLALVVGVVGTTIGLVRAREAEALASARLNDVEAANVATGRALAETRSAKQATDVALADSEAARKEAEAVSTYMAEILERPSPNLDGREVKVADLLHRAAARVARDFPNSPRIQGRMYNALGHAYRGLGLPARAVEMYKQYVDRVQKEFGAEAAETGDALAPYGDALMFDDQDLQAIAELERGVRILEATRGPRHRETLEAKTLLGKAYRKSSRIPEALRILQQVKDIAEESNQTSDRALHAVYVKEYGAALIEAGRIGEALAILETGTRAYQNDPSFRRRQGYLILANDLAVAYLHVGEVAKGAQLHRAIYESQRELLGEDHPHTLTARYNWAIAAAENGEPAAPLVAELQDVLARRERVCGPDHIECWVVRAHLPLVRSKAGERQEAIREYEELLLRLQKRFGRASPETLRLMNMLKHSYAEDGQWKKCTDMFDEILRLHELPEAADYRLDAPLHDMARLLAERREFDTALVHQKRAVAECVKNYGEKELRTFLAQADLATLLREAGHADEAIPVAESALAGVQNLLGPNHVKSLLVNNVLAQALHSAKNYDRAIQMHQEGVQRLLQVLSPDHDDVLAIRNNLALTWFDAGRQQEAVKLLEEVVTAAQKRPSGLTEASLTWLQNLASLHVDMKSFSEAIRCQRLLVEYRASRNGADDRKTLLARRMLASYLEGNKQNAEAAREYRECVERTAGRDGLLREHFAARRGLARVLRRRGDPQEANRLAEETIAAATVHFSETDELVWRMREELAFAYLNSAHYVPAGEHLAKLLARAPNTDPGLAPKWQCGLGKAEFFTGKPDQGIRHMEEAVELLRARIGGELSYRDGCSNLAECYRRSGRSADAVKLLEPMCDVLRRTEGPDSIDAVRILNLLAHSHYDAKQFDDAARITRLAFELGRSQLGEAHDDTIQCLRGLVTAHEAAGRMADAEKTYREIIRLQEKRPLPARALVLQDMMELTAFYGRTDEREKKRSLLLAVASADEELRRLQPLYVLYAKRDLGFLHWQEQKYGDALQLYTEAYDGFVKLLGPDNPATLQARMNQAAQHYGMKDYVAAAAILMPHWEHLKRLPSSPEITHQWESASDMLAQVYRDSKQLAKQEAVLRERLARASALTKVARRTTTGQLAICLANQGRLAEACVLLESLAKSMKPAGRNEVLDCCGMWTRLAEFQLAEKHLDEAIESLDQADALRKQIADSPTALDIHRQCLRGEALIFRKQFADAEQLLLAGYKGLLESQPSVPQWRQDSLVRAAGALRWLYDDWGQPDQAAKWAAKVDELKKGAEPNPPMMP